MAEADPVAQVLLLHDKPAVNTGKSTVGFIIDRRGDLPFITTPGSHPGVKGPLAAGQLIIDGGRSRVVFNLSCFSDPSLQPSELLISAAGAP